VRGSCPLREERRGRLAGPGDGGWAVCRGPTGIASPRTNVLPWCLPVKHFPNEFSNPVTGPSGAPGGRSSPFTGRHCKHRASSGHSRAVPLQRGRAEPCESAYGAIRTIERFGSLRVPAWHDRAAGGVRSIPRSGHLSGHAGTATSPLSQEKWVVLRMAVRSRADKLMVKKRRCHQRSTMRPVDP
jgi:hypothetical protein